MRHAGIAGFALGATLATAAWVGPANGLDAIAAVVDLLPDEENTIAVFREVGPSVVFVQSTALRRDLFTMNVFETPQGSGSGFVWDGSGHVVTNFHVVQGASSLTVTLNDGNTYEAKLVGVDPSKDLAVLRIDAPADALHPVRVGASDGLQVGQKVVAIGNPFGLDQSLTTGVISALGREIQAVNGRTITDVVQTDAAINPGNSGGPLLDSKGRLIGVNTAIYSPRWASAGIGFAIPVDTVQRIVPELIAHGRVIRPALGVSYVHDAVAARFDIDGVIVGAVPEGGAAAQAGLVGLGRDSRGRIVLGDVIVAVDGARVRDSDELFTALESHAIGDEVTLTIQRGREQRKVKIRLQGSD